MKKLLLIASMFVSLFGCGVKGLLDEASIKTEVGKLSDALELYTRAIRQDKDSIEAYEGRADIYSKLKDHSKAASDYISAATRAEFSENKKAEAGSLYYQGALNRSIYYLSRLDTKYCESSAFYFKKACDLGVAEACKNECHPKDRVVAPTVKSVNLKVDSIHYPQTNGQSKMLIVLKPSLTGSDNSTLAFDDYNVTLDVYFGSEKTASVTKHMLGEKIITINVDKLNSSDNGKDIYVEALFSFPNGEEKDTEIKWPKSMIGQTVQIPL